MSKASDIRNINNAIGYLDHIKRYYEERKYDQKHMRRYINDVCTTLVAKLHQRMKVRR